STSPRGPWATFRTITVVTPSAEMVWVSHRAVASRACSSSPLCRNALTTSMTASAITSTVTSRISSLIGPPAAGPASPSGEQRPARVARRIDRDALRERLQLLDLSTSRALVVAVLTGLVGRRLQAGLLDLRLRLADLGEGGLRPVHGLLHLAGQGHLHQVEVD